MRLIMISSAKPEEPRFFEVSLHTLLGSYINGVYCEIRLPRFLMRLLMFVKKNNLYSWVWP